MESIRRMRKALACILTAAMLVGIVPSTALAYIGPVRTTADEVERISAQSNNGEFTLSNEYITFKAFDSRAYSSDSLKNYKAMLGDTLVTKVAPTATATPAMLNNGATFRKFSYRHANYADETGTKVNLKISSVRGEITSGNYDWRQENGDIIYGPSNTQKCIQLEVTFQDSVYSKAYVVSWLERVKVGSNRGAHGTDYGTDETDSDGSSQSWCVCSITTYVVYNNTYRLCGGDEEVTYPLGKMGHSSQTTPRINVGRVVSKTKNKKTTNESSLVNISGGASSMNTCTHASDGSNIYYTEANTDSYVTSNPFVGLSSFYSNVADYDENGLIFTFMPEEFSYDGMNNLKTTAFKRLGIEKYPKTTYENFFSCYGFRDLYVAGDPNIPQEPDEIVVPEDAGVVGIYKNGAGLRAIGAGNKEELEKNRLRENLGEALAVIYGECVHRDFDGGYYEFTGGKAALTPTVKAVWNQDDGNQMLRINDNGTIIQNGVNLYAPSFRFYHPNMTTNNDKLQLVVTEKNKLEIQMDPKINDDILYLNIPYSSSEVSLGKADTKGNLEFQGNVSFSTVFDGVKFDMERVSYSLDGKNNFKVNGIKASGSFNTLNMMGLELANVQGSIDTFKSEYNFSVKLDAYQLFTANATLKLARCNGTGVLMPDELTLGLVITDPDFEGIPVIPSCPVAEIIGVKGGFENLAQTVNGNYASIPPVQLVLGADAKVLKLIKGSADVTVGPTGVRIEGKGLKFIGETTDKSDVLESVYLQIGFNDMSKSVWTKVQGNKYSKIWYTGVDTRISAGINMSLLNKELDFLKISTNMDIGGFYGKGRDTDLNTGDWAYLSLDGNSKSTVKLQFPSDWDWIGGCEITSADLDLTAGCYTTMPLTGNLSFKQAAKQAFDRADYYFGVCAGGKIIGLFDARVWALYPDAADNPKKGTNWDYEHGSSARSPFSWNTALEKRVSTQEVEAADVEAADAEAVLQTSDADTPQIEETDLVITEEYSNDIVISGVTGEERGCLEIAFDGDVTEEQLKQHLTVKKNGTNFPLVWDTENGNIMSTLCEDGDQKRRAVFIHVGDGDAANGTYTVSSPYEGWYNITPDVITPSEELDTTFDTDSVTMEVKNPVSEKKYMARTFVSEEKNGTDYLIDETQLTAEGNYELTVNGLASRCEGLPTGNYYITTFLLEEMTGDFDTETPGEESAFIAIDSVGSEDTKVTYKNPNEPGRVQDVVLTAKGNETMAATWKAPADADTNTVNGYKISIFKQDEDGNWIDSGAGYEYDADTFGSKDGLTYDNATRTYTIDMAVTSGDQDVALPAGKSYKVGVCSYKLRNEGTEEESKYYGRVIQNTSEVLLPEYKCPEFDIALNEEGNVLTADEGTNGAMYTVSVTGDQANTLLLKAKNAGTTFTSILLDEQSAAELLATAEDETITGDSITVPAGTEKVRAYRITAEISHNGVKDQLVRHVVVQTDNVAPTLVLDQDVVQADRSGNYVVEGTTEPGATVSASNGTTAQADSAGRFAVEGSLGEETSLFLDFEAEDAVGNTSEMAFVIVSEYIAQAEPAPAPAPVVKVGSISISGISGKIVAGKKVKLTANVAPSDAANKNVTWQSSNTKYATVTADGVVTMTKKSAGKTVTITATAADGSGKTAIFKIKGMKGAVKSVSIKGAKSVKAGKSVKLKATVKTTKGTANKKLQWTSNKPGIATVSSSGKVKAVKGKKGKVKITAMATDGTNKKKTFTITVK